MIFGIVNELKFNSQNDYNFSDVFVYVFYIISIITVCSYMYKFNFHYFNINYSRLHTQFQNNSFKVIYKIVFNDEICYIYILCVLFITFTYIIIFFYKYYLNKNKYFYGDMVYRLQKKLGMTAFDIWVDEYDSILDLIEDPSLWKVNYWS